MERLKEIEMVLDALAEAARHFRSCGRCRRFFEAAYGAVADSRMDFPEFRPWGLVNLVLPELRKCAQWPRLI